MLALSGFGIFTARKRSLGQGNIFTPVCHSLYRGGMHGCTGGHAWFYSGGCMVLFGGVCVVFIWGACVVLFGGACIVLFRGCAWFLFRGGMHGFFSFFRYNEIRSMSGRYASYWNAFLFLLSLLQT